MLHWIADGQRADDATVVGRLAACHIRIRRFCALARRLGEVASAPDEQVREAATAVARYFGDALPLHAADEDESVAPRLASVEHLGDALAVVAAEHDALHATIAQLMPKWRGLATEPSRRGAMRDALHDGARQLTSQFDTHLAREEGAIFAAINALPLPVQADIVAEMIARRQVSTSASLP